MALDLTEKRNVLLCVAGSVAAVTAAEFARLLVSRGFSVRVVLSGSASDFIAPKVFEIITGNPVYGDGCAQTGKLCGCTSASVAGVGAENTDQIELGAWADVIVVAPATADEVAKIRSGFADSLMLSVMLSSRCPLVIATAIGNDQLDHVRTRENIDALLSSGVRFCFPSSSDGALGATGLGRMVQPYELFYETRRALSAEDYSGKHVLITTGSSREYIDPVTYVAKRTSGKMGIALAREAHRRGAKVTLIHGPIVVNVPRSVTAIRAITTSDMQREVLKSVQSENRPDVIIMAAALADYRPKDRGDAKWRRESSEFQLGFEDNPDVLRDISSVLAGAGKPLVVGFSETSIDDQDPVATLRSKIEEKSIDVVVGNVLEERFSGENHFWVIDRLGRQSEVSSTYKSRVADSILTAIARLF
jgi:phosphopantothenoylcysteine decarboxylase / phosphopantothenate---cysteine ligase